MMPEKSISEMSGFEKVHYSMSSKIFRATLMGSIIPGLASLAIGLGLYTYVLVNRYISEAFNLSRSAAAIIENVENTELFADEVMTAYHSLSDSELEETGSEAYLQRFASLTKRQDYEMIRRIFYDLLESSDVDDLYLAMYDEKSSALVYMADADQEAPLLPVEWEEVPLTEARKFLNYDDSGIVYDYNKTSKYGWICTAGVPVYRDSGEICAFVLADIQMDNVWNGMRFFLISFFIAMILMINLDAWLMTQHMKKTLVKPINDIAEAAHTYTKDKQAGAGVTDHFRNLDIRTGDELENLANVMSEMEKNLEEYEKKLTGITAEKERINTELELAARIQESMLPNEFPPFPDRTEFDVYAMMQPARTVGGDFYSFRLIDDDHLYLVIADVSGKGIPAALFMMACTIIMASNAMKMESPKKIIEDVNNAICSNNNEEMFVTIWLGILEISTGRLRAVNAGHEYPIVMHAGGNFEILKDPHGLVAGGMLHQKYEEYELQLEPGSKLFVYTDGIPEATDAGNVMFGTDRLLENLNQCRDGTAQQVIKRVEDGVAEFVGSTVQFDDMTMMCIEYKGKSL